jgi:NtrC-family two-component system sensor histidine kinase KinB
MAEFFGLRSFRVRILLGYGAAIVIIAIVFGWSVANVRTLGLASESILKENYKSILAAENMINDLERQDSLLLYELLGINPATSEAFRAMESDFLQWLGKAKDNITIESEVALLGKLEAGYLAFLGNAHGFYQKPTAERAAFYQMEVQPLFFAVRQSCVDLRELNQEAMVQASAQAQQLASKAVLRMVAAGAAVTVIGLVLSIFLARRLASPVERMREAAKRIADGDYGVQVPVSGQDELAQLAGQFNSMAKRLEQYHAMNIGKILAEKHKTEAILQSVDDGIVVVDPEFSIMSINLMAGSIFNVSPEEVSGKHVLEAIRDERLSKLLKQAIETGQQPELDEKESTLAVSRGEKQVFYSFSVVPVHIGHGPVIAAVLLLRDVTRLRELDRLKSEFVMTASHELRTPLTSIGMSIDLLRDKVGSKLSDRERQLLTVAQEDVQRLKALVNELLDLSKIEAGKLEIDFERVPLPLICEKTAKIMATQAEQAGVELAFSCGEGLPEVRVDPNKITWVLVNLVGNALRHTPENGHVRVAAKQAGRFAHVSVSDDGEGIPLEFQTKIFDKFVQVKSRRTSSGTGLGLAICKEIVRAHGGTIWVESTPGEGTIFTFTVPIAE